MLPTSLVEDEQGEPLSVGRKTRTIAPALNRLLKARDKGCRFPVPIPSGDWSQLPLQHCEAGIHINERTAATRWLGERCSGSCRVTGVAIEGERSNPW